ncbi:siderophore-interacting protein [Planobispora rosea]|uniref:Siderophore-interacting protein n=1 Tax=Planobispora rosea TaxID=35762 RepID=A0A8J3WBM2_PLARO|nr:siderophore-interacting protein [Planobispora rosea]GGS52706.1 siderophore-interacting protein [Planobispora rosea]GIH83088.1 siderophore-interacting protein [Planobispora rosea]
MHDISVVRYDLKPRLLEVRRAEWITPSTVRVTLAGDDLAGFQERAPQDHVKLFFPVDGAGAPVMPAVGPDGWEFPPGAPDPVFRDYTVRSHRPGAGELDIDMVVHGHGPASAWAAQAAPGQRIGVLGPRGSVVVPFNFDWYLLGADETALPALARWLEALPAGARVIAFAEVADAREEQHIETAADVTLTWLHRDGAAPGASGVLERAVRELELPPGDGFVWIAGEAGALKPIRRHLREAGHPKEWTDIDGYWKRGTANLDHHRDQDED